MKRKWLRVLVTLALLTILGFHADWRDMGRTVAQVSALSIAWALLIYAGAQVVSSLRWATFATRLGVAQPLNLYFRLYCIGMFCNLFLPTSVGGDVVRALRLGSASGRQGASARSVLADRLSGLAILLLFATFALALVPEGIPAAVRWSIWACTLLAAGGALACRHFPPGLARLPGVRLVVESVGALLDHTGTFIITTLLSIAVQGLNVVMVWVLGASLGLPVPPLFYWILVPAVSLLTMLPISLNGMGVREGATALLLAPFGVTTSQGITLAVLWFMVMSAISLTGALFYLTEGTPQRAPSSQADDVTASTRPQPGVVDASTALRPPLAASSCSREGAAPC
jgi:uncharacterized membrane protein YbhN (UPF0104 family)